MINGSRWDSVSNLSGANGGIPGTSVRLGSLRRMSSAACLSNVLYGTRYPGVDLAAEMDIMTE